MQRGARTECTLEYLARVADMEQYPGAHCDMSDNVYIYGRTTSSGNESMNNANKNAQEQYGVDVIVATMILLELATQRYDRKRLVA